MPVTVESGPDHIKRMTGKTADEVKAEKAKKAATAKKKREDEAKKQPGYQAPSGTTTKSD